MGQFTSSPLIISEMAMFTKLISLAIIVVTEANQFTAFHPKHQDFVHAGVNDGNFNAETSHRRIRGSAAFNQHDLAIKDHLQVQPGFQGVRAVEPLGRRPVFISTGNLVQQTKAFAESGKALFKFLENYAQAQLTFDMVFESSACLGNVGDVIQLMDETVRLVEENTPEIVYLEALVENLRGEKDAIKQTEDSAKMLRTLGHLVPNLARSSANLCITNPEDSVRSFRSLGHAMIDIRNHRDIEIDDVVRQLLEESSTIMYETAKFLANMNRSLEHFRKTCESKKMKDGAIYNTIADIMESLGDLFNVLQLPEKTVAIKKQAEFLKSITRPFAGLDTVAILDTDLICDFDSGSYEELALTLEDLAEIIKSVGVEKLSADLGINLDFSGF